MATDSLIGGDVYNKLSPAAQAMVDAVMGDTIDGEVTKTVLTNTGAVMFTSVGAGGVAQGVAYTGLGQAAVAAEIESGQVKISVILPPGMTMAFEGPALPANASELNTYFDNVVDTAFPLGSSPTAALKNAELKVALAALMQSIAKAGPIDTVAVRLVAMTDASAGGSARVIGENDVLFESVTDGGAAPELLVFLMNALSPGKTLVLKAVEAALINGAGRVRIDGDQAAMLNGDEGEQSFTGGDGNDTLVGGGGNDTLTGGLGSDIFGVSALNGHLTITDFDVTRDKLAFTLPGVSSLEDIAPYFTALTHDADGSTLHFGDAFSITLVGTTPEQLTLDLLQFTL